MSPGDQFRAHFSARIRTMVLCRFLNNLAHGKGVRRWPDLLSFTGAHHKKKSSTVFVASCSLMASSCVLFPQPDRCLPSQPVWPVDLHHRSVAPAQIRGHAVTCQAQELLQAVSHQSEGTVKTHGESLSLSRHICGLALAWSTSMLSSVRRHVKRPLTTM